ncbi:MAG TPA: dTDP-4-amino-4,6-dideoxygalactose transaminase [Chloroflexi bacterium]|nr:dTDP-4-amino-4,6-dideoxygalactose transaminase [Chloroflexota bacterium]
MYRIPFNRPFTTGKELAYIQQVIESHRLAGDGAFTKKCHRWLEEHTGSQKVLLTHSCTAALEMAAILTDIEPGDEVIMPSFTFVSTANAFVLRGGVPVFVDIRPDTLNVDETQIEEAITPRTKAIAIVHYAGVGCEMDAIMRIAQEHNLPVIEDAAQALLATYRGRPLGSIGHLAGYSFHETKNVVSGEGGALLINDPRYVDRAEIVREKGTNRSQFFRGQVDKYTWMDIGSSYLPAELEAAFLWAQLEEAESITRRRKDIWQRYYEEFADLEREGKARRPVVPAECEHNGHIFYLLFRDLEHRTAVQARLREAGVQATFHYVPLHDSPAGKRYGRAQRELPLTRQMSERLLRLPLWAGMTDDEVSYVIEAVYRSA